MKSWRICGVSLGRLGWPAEYAGQPRLRKFVIDLFLSGNGALIFSNAFVEWAVSEAIRRARPRRSLPASACAASPSRSPALPSLRISRDQLAPRCGRSAEQCHRCSHPGPLCLARRFEISGRGADSWPLRRRASSFRLCDSACREEFELDCGTFHHAGRSLQLAQCAIELVNVLLGSSFWQCLFFIPAGKGSLTAAKIIAGIAAGIAIEFHP